ncbi:hypothetical protein PoB_006656400 [Plakobranchus ocellatus]|uniref:Uncharacterized protein n=1 Tax=Plakobranchus ocellatus TaxID=259542 RepID=A0AAV4D770_9GAST|nr:hypothetical protein PoB_006656400 [Plakobranchus ocellatus]
MLSLIPHKKKGYDWGPGTCWTAMQDRTLHGSFSVRHSPGWRRKGGARHVGLSRGHKFSRPSAKRNDRASVYTPEWICKLVNIHRRLRDIAERREQSCISRIIFNMRHLDLSFEGKHLAERNQLDNGKLPHGGYRGSKKHPPSHLSYDKGRDFQHRLEEELSRMMDVEEMAKHGGSPSWSILVHNSPSYTDESPLITNNLLAASKLAQINGINMYNRTSLLPKKCPRSAKPEGAAYYRPNRMHQYLSATELKNSASEDVNIKYGRPTRTTLLRARQRSNSAPSNHLEKKQNFAQRLDELKTAPGSAPTNTEYLQLQSVRDGESLHSYLTGARYNRPPLGPIAETSAAVPRVLSARLSERSYPMSDRPESAVSNNSCLITRLPKAKRARSPVRSGRSRRGSETALNEFMAAEAERRHSRSGSRRASRDSSVNAGRSRAGSVAGSRRASLAEMHQTLIVDSRRSSKSEDASVGLDLTKLKKGRKKSVVMNLHWH